jgi:hypothetical protein
MITLDSQIIYRGKQGSKTVREIFVEGGAALEPLKALGNYTKLAMTFAEEKERKNLELVSLQISEIRSEVRDSIREVELFMSTFGTTPTPTLKPEVRHTLFSLL